MSAAILVVVPTYNELENLGELLPAIIASRADLDILVVDDASPDGTGSYVEGLCRREPRVSLLSRPRKLGLGTAYAAAFRLALARGYRAVVQMDADLSHAPAEIDSLVAAIEGCDVAIGSRYLEGSRIRQWRRGRWALSRLANFAARLLSGTGIRDLTGGFKCWSAAALAAVRPSTLRSRDFAFQIESTWAAHKAGCRIVEVPIDFRGRGRGRSKASTRMIGEAISVVCGMFRRRLFRARPKTRSPALSPSSSGRLRRGAAGPG